MKSCLVILSCLFFLLIGNYVHAQSFFQSAGVSILRSKAVANAGVPRYQQKVSVNGVTYFPRKNVLETGNTALSIGLPVTVGWQGNFGSDVNMFSIGVDAPLVADYNF